MFKIRNLFSNNDAKLFASKCAFLSVIFTIIWLYFKIPMGFWAVYSCFIVLQSDTAATLKKGFLRISGHILVAFFSAIYAFLFLHDFIILSFIPILFGYFIICYLISGSDNIRYAGIAGGLAFGMMLFEHPLSELTEEVIIYRTSIIIICAISGILFDHLVFPIKIHEKANIRISKIQTDLIDIIQFIFENDKDKYEQNKKILITQIEEINKFFYDVKYFSVSNKNSKILAEKQVLKNITSALFVFQEFIIHNKEYQILESDLNILNFILTSLRENKINNINSKNIHDNLIHNNLKINGLSKLNILLSP